MTHTLQGSTVHPGVLVRSETSSLEGEAQAERIKAIVVEHYAFLWRSLRRLGVPPADVEDAAQKCLWIVAQRLGDIVAGREKSFLFGVALRVAKVARDASRARRDVFDESLLDRLPAQGPDAGELLDDQRARVFLDAILEELPLDLRAVFVLYELEELTMAEIAAALSLPPGTVASRLRRARKEFEGLSRRLQRQLRTRESGR